MDHVPHAYLLGVADRSATCLVYSNGLPQCKSTPSAIGLSVLPAMLDSVSLGDTYLGLLGENSEHLDGAYCHLDNSSARFDTS